MPVIRPPRWHVLCIRHGEDVGRLRLERPVDLSEADGEYVLTAELHGVDPEDVEIDVELRGEE